jgi:hypothetical protein
MASSRSPLSSKEHSQPGADEEATIEVPSSPHDDHDQEDIEMQGGQHPADETALVESNERVRDHPLRAFDPTLIDQRAGIAELFALAHARAPRVGDMQLEWITLSQASQTFRMSKAVLANWATRGYIASVKGDGANAHRLVHIDNVLHYMADSITSRK